MRQRLVEKIEQLRKELTQHEEALRILDSLGEAERPKASPKQKPSPKKKYRALPKGVSRVELKIRVLELLKNEPLTSTEIIEKLGLQEFKDSVYTAMYELKRDRVITRDQLRVYRKATETPNVAG